MLTDPNDHAVIDDRSGGADLRPLDDGGADRRGGEDAAAVVSPPVLWTPDQVCAAWGCRRTWLYDQVEAGRLPFVRLGRQLRFRPDDITAYVDAHTAPAVDPRTRQAGSRTGTWT